MVLWVGWGREWMISLGLELVCGERGSCVNGVGVSLG